MTDSRAREILRAFGSPLDHGAPLTEAEAIEWQSRDDLEGGLILHKGEWRLYGRDDIERHREYLRAHAALWDDETARRIRLQAIKIRRQMQARISGNIRILIRERYRAGVTTNVTGTCRMARRAPRRQRRQAATRSCARSGDSGDGDGPAPSPQIARPSREVTR